MPKIIDLTGDDVWLDLSTATSIPEFIRALRLSADGQNEVAMRDSLLDTARCLEKLWAAILEKLWKQIGGK